MNESKLHAIYAWLDPRKPGNFIYEGLEFVFEYEPFYVGQTVDLKDRKRCHLKNSYSCRDSNIFKSRKFNKIKSETGNHPIFLVIRENLSREDANNTEVDMISKIGTMNSGLGPLTNLTIGADKGVLGLRWSKESKEKRKGAGNPMYGKTGELHHFFGVKFSEETRKKQSIKKLKYIYHIFDPDGKEFITTNLRVWEKENEFRYGSISKIVRGEVGHYKGWTAYIEGKQHLLKITKKISYKGKPKGVRYIIKKTSGEIFETDNFTGFCREHKLNRDYIVQFFIDNDKLYRQEWSFYSL